MLAGSIILLDEVCSEYNNSEQEGVILQLVGGRCNGRASLEMSYSREELKKSVFQVVGSNAALKVGFGAVSDISKVSDEQEGPRLPTAQCS